MVNINCAESLCPFFSLWEGLTVAENKHFTGFQDKVAVVTGASRGIGLEYAKGLVELGAKVVVADILDGSDAVSELENMGGSALYIHTDVADESSTEKMAAQAADHFGGIDFLVNNAAIYGGMSRKPWDQLTVAEWEKMLKVNVIGNFLAAKAVVPYMKKRGGGRIVNIASGVCFTAPPNMMHYNASKSAVIGFTRSLAKEVGDDNINVNSVSPGLVMSQASIEQTSPEYAQAVANQRCLKRNQEPSDVVGAVLFLLSDAAAFITGQNIVVDGGIIFH